MPIGTIGGIKAISAGYSDSSALTGDGRVHLWGENDGGSVGSGNPGVQRTPYAWTAARQVAPGSPEELQVVPGQQLAYLYWKKGPGVVTQYDVTTYVNGTVGTSLAVDPPALHGVVRNLSTSAQYTFTVAGQNCLGSSAPTPLSAPVIPVGTASSNSSFSVEGEQFTDRLSATVDTASGNLRLTSDDVQVAGTGIDLEIKRFYNSRAEVSNIEWFGRAWSSNVGRDVRLIEYWVSPTVQSMRYIGPGGYSAYFIRKPDGSYEPPPGVNAQLVKNANNSYTLTEDSSGLRQEFSNLGDLVAQSDRYGNRIQIQFDSNTGLHNRIVDSQGRAFDIGYNTNRDVASIRDATGRLWQYQYDANLNLTLYTDPAGGRTQFEYDPTRLLTRIITPEGRQITFTYDSDRRVKSIRYPLAPASPVTLFGYRPATDAGFSTVVTDANGHPTTYTFDPAGRTTQVTDGLGNMTAASYTSRSNISSVTTPGGDTTRLGYDLARNLISARAATGAEQRADFNDPAHPHLPTALIDTQGNAAFYTYNQPGSVTTARNQLPAENQVTMTYNSNGTPATSRDARGALTSYSNDAQGNLSLIAPPAPLGTLQLSYDGLSRVTRLVDGVGKQRTFTYDPLDRLTSVTYGDGSVVRRDYDRDGNLITTTEVDATTTQTTRMYYDQRNRLFQRDEPTGRSVRYTYDAVGNLTTMTDSGGAVSYSYDAANLLRSVTEPGGARTTMDYDAAYNRTVTAYPNGVSLNRTYDDSNRLATISAVRGGQTLFRKSYTYTKPSGSFPDSALRHQVTELDGTSTVYTYDAMNRLTLARTQNPGDGSLIESYEYTLDGDGNRRIQFVDKPGTSADTTDNYIYNTADQLVNRNGETFSYDGAGNLLTSSTGANFTYNAANQTTSTRSVSGGTTTTYDYRGDGQAERTTMSSGISFGHTQLGVSSQTTAAGEQYFTRDPSGGLLGQRGLGGTQYYLTDGLGSVIMVTGADGSTTATFNYDPFGNTTTATGNTAITRWRYAGQFQDPTGLYKIGERYYDPKLGRWTQPDQYLSSPLDPRNANRYLYTGANPVNYTDTTGLSACDNVKIFHFLGLAIGAPIAVLGYVFGAKKFKRLGAALSILARKDGVYDFSRAALAKVPQETVAQLGAEFRLIGASIATVTEAVTRAARVSLGC